LKEQIEKFRDYKEQVVVLRAERDHLENKVKTLSEKVKYLSTPVRKKKLFQFLKRHSARRISISGNGTVAVTAG
jgi:protein QN1